MASSRCFSCSASTASGGNGGSCVVAPTQALSHAIAVMVPRDERRILHRAIGEIACPERVAPGTPAQAILWKPGSLKVSSESSLHKMSIRPRGGGIESLEVV